MGEQPNAASLGHSPTGPSQCQARQARARTALAALIIGDGRAVGVALAEQAIGEWGGMEVRLQGVGGQVFASAMRRITATFRTLFIADQG